MRSGDTLHTISRPATIRSRRDSLDSAPKRRGSPWPTTPGTFAWTSAFTSDDGEPRGGYNHRGRAAGDRYANRRPALQAGPVSRRADQHDVADTPAVHRRRGAGAYRRGSHPRPTRRVHVLHRRRAGAGGNFRKPERAVRSIGREPDRLQDRRVGRGVRKQECRRRRHHDANSDRRISRSGSQLRWFVQHQRPVADREHQFRSSFGLFVRGPPGN